MPHSPNPKRIRNVQGTPKKRLTLSEIKARRAKRRAAKIAAHAETLAHRNALHMQQIMRERYGRLTLKRKPGGRDNTRPNRTASQIVAAREDARREA